MSAQMALEARRCNPSSAETSLLFVDGWLRYEVTARDVRRYARALRARSWRRTAPAGSLGRRLLAINLITVVILVVTLTLMEGGLTWLWSLADEPIVRIVFGTLFVVLGLLAATLLALPPLTVWASAKRRDVLGPRELRLGKDGIHLVTPSFTTVVAWGGLCHVEVWDGDVHLYLSDAEAMLVPAHAFESDAERTAFVELCHRSMAAERITQTD